jgi:phytoene synthase
VVASYALPEAHFGAVIDGMAMDLERNRYPDFAELERYCHLVAGVVGLLSAEIFGYRDARTRSYAHDLGIAFQLTNIIRDVGEDARRGRVYLPEQELAAHGISAAAIVERRGGPGFPALMTTQVARAREWYRRALGALPTVDRHAQRPGLVMAAIYGALLDEIERDGFSVLERRIALTPLRKFWIAWRTARRA